jgi:hypothetical protein
MQQWASYSKAVHLHLKEVKKILDREPRRLSDLGNRSEGKSF